LAADLDFLDFCRLGAGGSVGLGGEVEVEVGVEVRSGVRSVLGEVEEVVVVVVVGSSMDEALRFFSFFVGVVMGIVVEVVDVEVAAGV
jgi:hypothetical protein